MAELLPNRWPRYTSLQVLAEHLAVRSRWRQAGNRVSEKDAVGVEIVRHRRMVNLIGCCAEGDERLLVADYMPNDTLSKHLFHWDRQPLPWEMRVKVAYHVAQALDHCGMENRKIYHHLIAYRILFDEKPMIKCKLSSLKPRKA